LSHDPIFDEGDPNGYSYCGDDPVNFIDPSGLCLEAGVNEAKLDAGAAWNSGFGLGNGMRVAGDFYNQQGGRSTSTSLNFANSFAGSMMNMGGGMITPQSYVNGFNMVQNRAQNVMVGQYLSGSGNTWSAAQGLSSIVGDVTGYNGVMAGGFGVDRQPATLLSTSDRWSQGLMGGSQIILTGAGLNASYNPNATFLRPSVGMSPVIENVTTPINELRTAGLKDAHHVIQDAAVRDLSGYNTQLAPGVQLRGPSTAIGSPHYLATQIQRMAGGGTYAAEREIAANSLRAAGYSEAQIQQALTEADNYFQSIGVTPSTPTRIPGNRIQ
jgi:hypothetical protein